MTNQKKSLLQFTLKLSKTERTQMKVLCATDPEMGYQYKLFDTAILWAIENKEMLMAIANPKKGSNKSYYICETVEDINKLEMYWDCNSTRAVHSAIVQYLKYRKYLAETRCTEQALM